MKKLLFVVLAALMVASLALASCGSSTPTKITVATDATWPPFESVNTDTNKIEGFDIDLMNAVAAKAGLEIEFINVGWDPLLTGMAQGTYDAAISSITIYPERQEKMLFSDPYYPAGQIITVEKSNTTITGLSTLKGKVGAQLGTTGAIEAAKVAGVDLKTYDEIGLAFVDLMNGQIDAVVCDNPVAALYVVKNADKLKLAGAAFTTEQYGIAVAKGKEDILKKINEGLKKVLAEGIIKTLEEKWYKTE